MGPSLRSWRLGERQFGSGRRPPREIHFSCLPLTENAEVLLTFSEAVYGSRDTVLHDSRTEIQQKSELHVGEPQVRRKAD